MALLYDGDAARATVSLELGLKLNRYDPQNFVWYTLAALALLFDERAERASERAVAALKVRPAWRAAVRAAAGASAALGRVEESASLRRQWLDAPPSADALEPLWRCNPTWATRMEALTWRA
jgi:hypothetical protein